MKLHIWLGWGGGAGNGAVSGAGAGDKDESVCQVVPSRVDRLKDR